MRVGDPTSECTGSDGMRKLDAAIAQCRQYNAARLTVSVCLYKSAAITVPLLQLDVSCMQQLGQRPAVQAPVTWCHCS
jgi:hypothetical protein